MTRATLFRLALVSGAVASATSSAALAMVALGEGLGAAQPLNATSHWLNGDRAATRKHVDLRHTAVGLGTHCAATMFWALLFEASMDVGPMRDRSDIIARGTGVAAVAALVDYTITPKRFTPGWELVLTKRSMALVYAAIAAGFVAARV